MKTFFRILAAAVVMTAGLIAFWLLILLVLFAFAHHFGPIQGVVASIFVTMFIATALIHWSDSFR